MSGPTYWDAYEDWRCRIPSFSNPTQQGRLWGQPGQLIAQAAGASVLCGFTVGSLHGGNTAALRFRAEHTHKLPKSTKQWYFYHKRKNYYVMKYGIMDGAKLGARLAFWTTAYFVAETSVDFIRGGRKDFVSSTTAAVGLSGIFSLINRFNFQETARMAKLGLAAGLTYGLLQDAIAVGLTGRRLNYVDALVGRRRDAELPAAT